ncbi:baculoviral IAP repeat-containing protein 2-like [Dreissena polymorpha]|uniref:Uncharacterized protein n=1 Tax=Dreissena polymorpha TaxID=45954 RepID=A0A9D4JHP8_DREPO|nr:baculoviral IAP repeat-containing protein 2-like [Dreissena polymorpha]KAH3810514.1 hypothetical protein DPMN_138909 [Dreissena polymorpha]
MTPVVSPVNAIVTRLAEGKRVHPKESMRHESLRLCTFRTYQTYGKPSCIKLAKAGFYYASQGDEVICYCCAKRISNWNERDDPLRAHKLVSPSCPFLIRNSEVNAQVTDDINESSNPRLNRILHSLDTSDEQCDREERNSGPAASEDVSPLSTSRLNLNQNGTRGHTAEYTCTAGQSTQHLSLMTEPTVGTTPYSSSNPEGSCGDSSSTKEPVFAPNSGRKKAPPVKGTEIHPQDDSGRYADSVKEKLLSENRALKAQWKCLRCHRNDVCIAFLPCGHLVSCETCSTDPSARKCFSCDAAVKARIKAFIA